MATADQSLRQTGVPHCRQDSHNSIFCRKLGNFAQSDTGPELSMSCAVYSGRLRVLMRSRFSNKICTCGLANHTETEREQLKNAVTAVAGNDEFFLEHVQLVKYQAYRLAAQLP